MDTITNLEHVSSISPGRQQQCPAVGCPTVCIERYTQSSNIQQEKNRQSNSFTEILQLNRM